MDKMDKEVETFLKGKRPRPGLRTLLFLVAMFGGISLLAVLFSGPRDQKQSTLKPQGTKTYGTQGQTQKKGDPWANRKSEAIKAVQECGVTATSSTVVEVAASYFSIAKAQGNFIEYDGWLAFQVGLEGPLYEVELGYRVNGEKHTATWRVDLSKRVITSRNQPAFIFSGNNDRLRY